MRWTREQEKELAGLIQEAVSLEDIAERLKRSPDAIAMKMRRLGLEVPEKCRVKTGTNKVTTKFTTTGKFIEPVKPDDLPSGLEVMQLLWSAVQRLRDPSVSGQELRRLRLVVSSVKAYAALHVKYLLPLERFERKLTVTEKGLLVELNDILERTTDAERQAQIKRMIEELETSIKESESVPDVPEKLTKQPGS
jgi:predicted DNA-binding protein YlxM (UPF0122 family)